MALITVFPSRDMGNYARHMAQQLNTQARLIHIETNTLNAFDMLSIMDYQGYTCAETGVQFSQFNRPIAVWVFPPRSQFWKNHISNIRIIGTCALRTFKPNLVLAGLEASA